MRIGPHLLITLLLVAAGLLVYEVLLGARSATRVAPASHVGASGGQPARAGRRSLAGVEARVEANTGRIAALERALDQLRQGGAPLGEADHSGRRPPEPASASISLPRGGEGPFDEETLATLRAYVEEIERRKHEETQRRLVLSWLRRQDMHLTSGQEHDVVATTIAYRARARELMGRTWIPGAEGQAQRRRAVASLRNDYRRALSRFLSGEDAERMMQSPIAPGHGTLRTSEQPVDDEP